MPDWYRSLCRCPPLRPRTDQAGSRCPTHGRTIRQSLPQEREERRQRCRGHFRQALDGDRRGWPITATAVVASVGSASTFSSGRRFAAWLGLTPRRNSSGGKTRLVAISKGGDVVLRTLLTMARDRVLRAPARRRAGRVSGPKRSKREPATTWRRSPGRQECSYHLGDAGAWYGVSGGSLGLLSSTDSPGRSPPEDCERHVLMG